MERLDKKTWKSWKKASRWCPLCNAVVSAPINYRDSLEMSREKLKRLAAVESPSLFGNLTFSDRFLIIRIASSTRKARRRALHRSLKSRPTTARERRSIHREQKREAERLRERDEMKK